MARLFDISDEIRSVAADAISDLIDQLGKDCNLIYPPVFESCVNCIFDEIGNKSSNHWRNGGPIPFPNGSMCPYCNGAGQHATETFKNVKLLISAPPKEFLKSLPTTLQVPDGVISTKGFIDDLPDVLQCRKMVAQVNIQNIIKYTYELFGEPMDTNNIAQSKFWTAYWRRVGA